MRVTLAKNEGRVKSRAPLVALFVAVSMLSGCAMGGVSLEQAVPDKSAVTGSIAKPPSQEADTGKLSDQAAVKNVVSALNFSQWGKKPVPWANPDTGSQGTITTVAETKQQNTLCRQFQTSREAYDGASLYKGEACMQQGGEWLVTSFAPM